MQNVKYTSSGIIRNADKPRIGIVSAHSLNPDFLDSFITEGIDLGYETFIQDTLERLKNENPGIDDAELDALMERETEFYESDSSTYLLGAWRKIPDGNIGAGKYEIDKSGKNGDFAATFSSDSNNVSVDWSKTTTQCHHTSPCYVMSDGSGPCGDLDTKGDSVIAYTFPNDCFSKESE